MSRVAKSPINIPNNVKISIAGDRVKAEGPKGTIEHQVNDSVRVEKDVEKINVSAKTTEKASNALAGTTRSLIQNMVTGVSEGFEKKLEINGVGYRAQVQGKVLNLTLGLSHPVNYKIPEGITIEVPSQTQIVVKGVDKQQVGQVSAEIREFRGPEPYKGKGIKYVDEIIIRKEAKKA